MIPIAEKILDGFREFDSATLYEAAGQRGMVDPGIRPAWPGARICGRAMTIECPPGDNLSLHQAVSAAGSGDVLVANAGGYLQAGAWGEILTVAAQTQGVAGLVIDGAIRDIEAIMELNFPAFSRGIAIGACTKHHCGEIGIPIVFGGVIVRPGDLVIGNADGLVILEQERLEEIFRVAVERREREAELMDQIRTGRTTIELLGLEGSPGIGGR